MMALYVMIIKISRYTVQLVSVLSGMQVFRESGSFYRTVHLFNLFLIAS